MTLRQNQKGAALIAMLMMLVMLTVIGLSSITTTSLENKTAANERIYETRLNYEEAGIEPQVEILEQTILNGSVPASFLDSADGPVVAANNLEGEILSGTLEADDIDVLGTLGPDAKLDLNGTTVNMDTDFLFRRLKTGSAVEFASAYDGIGVSAGGGGAEIFYQFRSQASIGRGEGTITNPYQCVISGGCQK